MSLSIITTNVVNVSDHVNSLNFYQSKTINDTTVALNGILETYNLAASDTVFRMIAKGDISKIQDVYLTVTKKDDPATFAGVSVAFGNSSGVTYTITPGGSGNATLTGLATTTSETWTIWAAAGGGGNVFNVDGSVSGIVGQATMDVPFLDAKISFTINHGTSGYMEGEPAFGIAQTPIAGVVTVKDSLVVTGEIAADIYLWVKNLDTAACSLTVVLGGTNA
jgi:hypothetical protein